MDRRSGALGLHDPRGAIACLNSAMRRRGREDDEKKGNGSRQSRFRCETTRRQRNEIGPTKLHVYRIFPREKCHQQVLPTSTPPRNRLRGARPPRGSARPVGSAPRTRRRMERGVLARARARRASCRGSRAGGFVEREPRQNPRKVCANIGSSTAMNARGTHQTLTRYVRRAGGVDMGLRERVRDNAASRVCASWSETQSGMR